MRCSAPEAVEFGDDELVAGRACQRYLGYRERRMSPNG
jgi:hypothetical protein